MNRRARRRPNARDPLSAKRIRELQHRVEQTGQPGRIYGLARACRDCQATGDLVLLPGKRAVGHVYHDPGCPAAADTVTWQPCPVN